MDLVLTEMLSGREAHRHASLSMNSETDQVGSDSDDLRFEFELEYHAVLDLVEKRRRNCVAERVGFEPTVEFPLHTLSKRAPSTTRTSLRL
jgi:hypothetical protein